MGASTRRKSIGTKRTGSGAGSTKSRGSSRDPRRRFVVCLSNKGYAASLEVRKIYKTVQDSTVEKMGMIRIVDESGEDYVYPRNQFEEIDLPRRVANALAI